MAMLAEEQSRWTQFNAKLEELEQSLVEREAAMLGGGRRPQREIPVAREDHSGVPRIADLLAS